MVANATPESAIFTIIFQSKRTRNAEAWCRILNATFRI